MTQLETHTVNLAFGDPLWVCLCADLCGFNILTDNPFKKKSCVNNHVPSWMTPVAKIVPRGDIVERHGLVFVME